MLCINYWLYFKSGFKFFEWFKERVSLFGFFHDVDDVGDGEIFLHVVIKEMAE